MEEAGRCDADGDVRGWTIGLTERLEFYFSRQLEIRTRNGELCPGEDRCRNKPWSPLWRRDEANTQAICEGCKLYESKPGTQPRDLIVAINAAIELDQVKECGGTFAYPDGLTAFEWASLKGLNAGRAAYQEKEQRQRQKDGHQQSELARLQARVATGNPTRPVR